jgi:endo-1,4-beta-xylanase
MTTDPSDGMPICPSCGRRSFLRAAAGLAGAACVCPGLAEGAVLTPGTLAATAASRGLKLGAAIGPAVDIDPAYGRLVARECELVVPEYEMKWSIICPKPSSFDFRGADLRQRSRKN